ncbi:MAG: thiamine phosphate synthase [Phycisphaerae bacterium]|nr:thiamine phosphate synthase [Phycisphaerae bacterium]
MQQRLYRILDANLNRAREALRVIEEFFRFVRDDREVSIRVKQLRHALNEIADRVGREKLLAARDSLADVGRDIPSPSLDGRTGPRPVAAASFKRLQEALRAIEEYAAPIDPQISAIAARLRFEAYDLEKQIMTAAAAARFGAVRLYLLIGSDLCPPPRMIALVPELLAAGVDCLQLREKHLSDRQTYDLSQRLAEHCHAAGELFIVNDRADLAAAVGADGLHLGQDDLPLKTARTLCPNAIIGLSTHNLDQVAAAIDQRPDYIAVGPAFATATKPHEPVAGLAFIRQAVERLDAAGIDHVAIGGITLENLDQLRAAGVRRIAVAAAVLKSPDPVDAARRLAAALG